MMSVHDALEAWQRGEITASRAMALSGAANILELYGLAEACGVEITLELADGERNVAAAVTRSIEQAVADKEFSGSSAPPGNRAA